MTFNQFCLVLSGFCIGSGAAFVVDGHRIGLVAIISALPVFFGGLKRTTDR